MAGCELNSAGSQQRSLAALVAAAVKFRMA